MKSKISITLSDDLLSDLERIVGRRGKRSQIVEKALRDYIQHQARQAREQRDREILNRNADALNQEAEEVLSYQP